MFEQLKQPDQAKRTYSTIITKYKGYYPDLDSFGQGTNNQAVNAGQGPSLYSIGVDAGAYPAARTFTVGANIQL